MGDIRTLSIDIETYCELDLSKTGVYAYAGHPSFEILLLAYSFDEGEIKIVDLANGQELPKELTDAIYNYSITKTAFNANFERVCLTSYLKRDLAINGWECTMVKAGMAGLPISLAMASVALKLPMGKMAEGKALIRYFCTPCKPTKANMGRSRNLPKHDAVKWELFIEYCKRDVWVEQEVRKHLSFFRMPDKEKKLYHLDQMINDRGIKLDSRLLGGALEIDALHSYKMLKEAKYLTALDNPNSSTQLKEWLSKQMGQDVTSLTKESTANMLKRADNIEAIKALELRQEMSKTSIKKYEAMNNVRCKDFRARGLLHFYGAARTGRWAGRLIQVQNLPQNHLPDLNLARELVINKDYETLKLLFGSVPNVLSQLIRTAFVAEQGRTFLIADFSAIEARIIAWLANESWRLEVFKSHGKIYEASAAAMFDVPLEEVTKEMRQKGKVAELALGYQGAAGALLTMGALKMGLKEEELPTLVKAWRGANRQIVKLWQQVQKAAIDALEHKATTSIGRGITLTHDKANNILFIRLPSGRLLSYQQPQLSLNRFGGKALKYLGMNQVNRSWELQETYGGKLVENIVQAIARDCLADAMLAINKAGYDIVMHVHDEVVIEVEDVQAQECLKEVLEILSNPLPWAPGLVLKAEGYITPYYKKD